MLIITASYFFPKEIMSLTIFVYFDNNEHLFFWSSFDLLASGNSFLVTKYYFKRTRIKASSERDSDTTYLYFQVVFFLIWHKIWSHFVGLSIKSVAFLNSFIIWPFFLLPCHMRRNNWHHVGEKVRHHGFPPPPFLCYFFLSSGFSLPYLLTLLVLHTFDLWPLSMSNVWRVQNGACMITKTKLLGVENFRYNFIDWSIRLVI